MSEITTRIPFDEIFQFVFKIYDVLMVSAHLIWIWLASPIDEELAEFLEISAETTNMEMMFGSLLIAAIMMAAVKMFNPL